FADHVVRPNLYVTWRAALHEQHEGAVADSSEEIRRLARFVNEPRELTDEVLHAERADFLTDGRELVRLDRHELANARLNGLRERCLEALDEELALSGARCGIAFQCFVQVVIERVSVRALVGRNTEANRRLAVKLRLQQLDLE